MKKNPKVSVIMSVYNGEQYLREAVDSILNQTFTDFEFIIINDGSTDGTKRILESCPDPRIHLFHQKNIGLTKSLNKAISLSRGEFIARMDDDDISLNDRLEKEVSFLDNNKTYAMVCSYMKLINEKTEILDSYWDADIQNCTLEQIYYQLHFGNCIPHSSVMIRKPFIHLLQGYNEKYGIVQDYDLWLKMIKKYPIYKIDDFLILFRIHRNSITHTNKISLEKSNETAKYIAVKNMQKLLNKIKLTFVEENIIKERYYKFKVYHLMLILFSFEMINKKIIKEAPYYVNKKVLFEIGNRKKRELLLKTVKYNMGKVFSKFKL